MNKLDLGTALLLFCVLLLSSCVDMNAKWAAQDAGKCSAYGARPGTPAYVQCRAQLDAARTQAIATYGTIK